ncbi:MAG: hypothetical protein ACXVBB_23565 [Isosphaeraceae bacterium]
MTKAACDDLTERICEDDDFIGAIMRNRNEIYAPDEDGSDVIRMLLDGYLDLDERGLVQREYLKGRAELVARAILSDMIREDRVPPELRGLLADLLDPTSDNVRTMNFSFRRRARSCRLLSDEDDV